MLRAAIAFFVLALIAYFLGATGVGGLSMDIGKFLIIAFVALALISLVVGLVTGRKPNVLP